MDDVTRTIYHDVAIMSVFYCKQVSEDAVRCQTADEVQLSFFKLFMEVPFVKSMHISQFKMLHFDHLLL